MGAIKTINNTRHSEKVAQSFESSQESCAVCSDIKQRGVFSMFSKAHNTEDQH